MPLITCIPIHVATSLVGLRNKVNFIACELGISDIRASRLAAACSEAARDLLEQDVSPNVSLSVSNKQGNQLRINITPWHETSEKTLACQRYAALVDAVLIRDETLILCQHLGGSAKVDEDACALLSEKMRRSVMPTRAELEIQATHDALTHVLNRYALEERFTEELERARRYQFSMSVLMLDIDFFKQVNDTYGHHAGDACLVSLSLMLRSAPRKQDIAARFGGEEFVLVLPHTPPQEAMHVADRLRKNVENTPVYYEEKTIHFTISLGMSGFEQPTGISCKQLLEMADQALYEAKESGRNRVCTKLES